MAEEERQNNGGSGAQPPSVPPPPGAPPPEPSEMPEVLPLLPVAEISLFPRMILPLMVLEPSLVAAVQESILQSRIIALFAVKEGVGPKTKLDPEDLYTIGLAAYILKMSRGEEGVLRLMVQGLGRVRLKEMVKTEPHFEARVEPLPDVFEMDQEIEALMANLRGLFTRVLDLSPTLPAELRSMNQNVDHPGLLADMIVSALNLKRSDKQDLLATLDIKARLKKVSFFLQRDLDILELGSKIHSEVKGQIDKGQREYYLREQLKAIKAELGEKDETAVELEELERRLAEKDLPQAAAEAARRELERLKRMNAASAEYTVARTYLDWIVDLPWKEETPDNLDLAQAQAVLDEDHHDLEKIKKRIVEYLAVRQLQPEMKGPILCLVGPPGTGKTSLGRSIARAVGRNFVRLSLGGVRDEAEIRGHRRTYVGALPGRIIQGMKRAGSRNPVFMLDEVDKLGADFRGDPSSALLEVLDPEQNFAFSDHYLELDFDLSRVMFITTANILDTIPGALRDRMEVLTLAGYTEEEKMLIARRYLVPRQREAHGLSAKQILIRKAALRRLISEYTREAGLRNLEREIANVCRSVAVEVAQGKKDKTVIRARDLPALIGPPRFISEVRARTAPAGVATGLAWTQTGGDILFVEATAMPGQGQLTLTGQLGEVMKESAQAALSYIRSRSTDLGLDPDYFATRDIHVHVPAGAIPKDGPSAGVALTLALASLVTGRPVKPEVAVSGEITLRGLVLPVGGIKEKVLAAKRAGIKTVLLPARNEKDLSDVPEPVREEISLHLVSKIDEVLNLALKDARPK